MRKTFLLALTLSLIATPAYATFTEPYPGSFRINSDITCPAQYPVKTGESTLGGGYITTCYTTQAWSLYLAGGDDWSAWLAGTWTPEPTPTPTVTITATPEPVIQIQTQTVTDTRIVEKIIPCVPKDLSTAKKIKAEIKKLKKQLKKLNAKKTN